MIHFGSLDVNASYKPQTRPKQRTKLEYTAIQILTLPRNPKPETRNPKSETLIPKPETRNQQKFPGISRRHNFL
jgi:hypothetical protein